MRMTEEQKEILEAQHNVYIDSEHGLFNHDPDAEYGWLPIPESWLNMKDKQGSMIIRKVPDQLRRDFKAKCATAGVSQQDCIIKLMREYVSDAPYPSPVYPFSE